MKSVLLGHLEQSLCAGEAPFHELTLSKSGLSAGLFSVVFLSGAVPGTQEELNEYLEVLLFFFLKSLLNLLHYHFCFLFWFFWQWGMLDLTSPTRDCTSIPCIERQSLNNHWTTRQVPKVLLCFLILQMEELRLTVVSTSNLYLRGEHEIEPR